MKEHKLGSPWSADDDPVFASASGRPLYWRNVSKQGLEVAAERAELNRPGLAKLSMHGLRNTFASHLILDLKLDVVQVSKQLGHVRPSITSDTYARLFDQARHVSSVFADWRRLTARLPIRLTSRRSQVRDLHRPLQARRRSRLSAATLLAALARSA